MFHNGKICFILTFRFMKLSDIGQSHTPCLFMSIGSLLLIASFLSLTGLFVGKTNSVYICSSRVYNENALESITSMLFHVCLFVFIPKDQVSDIGRSPGVVQRLCILPSPLYKQGQNSFHEPLKLTSICLFKISHDSCAYLLL